MPTRQQTFATKTYTRVAAIEARSQEYKDRYGSLAHRLPVLIRSAGLAQALAYIEARGKDEGKQLLIDLASVLGIASSSAFITQARESQLTEYMHLTQQSLDALLWFKRFAQTILKVAANTDNKD